MDYEKKYKEALERAKTLYGNANGMILKKWVEKVFPELRESEDERIRKAILWCITTVELELGCKDAEGIAVAELKSWLEKQGELSKLSEDDQVSEDFIKALDTMLNDGLPDMYIVSEERVKNSAELLFSIARKQLKNEMQDWSEEDEKEFNQLLDILHTNGYESFDIWLKSLKDRVQLQNTWKPSDEQMEVLEFISDYHCFAKKNNQDIFKEFVKQLKKLREE